MATHQRLSVSEMATHHSFSIIEVATHQRLSVSGMATHHSFSIIEVATQGVSVS